MNVYYPNTKLNSPSTTCFQIGTSAKDDVEISFDLKLGRCKNGRKAEPVKFECAINELEMSCLDIKAKRKLVFKKKDV